MACNVATNEVLHRYFSRILTANFTWNFRTAIFKKPFFPRTPHLAAPSKAATGSCSGKKVVWDVFFSEKLGSSGCSVKSAGTLAKLWIYFLHQNTFYSLEKEPVLVSAKLTWKKRLTKKCSPAAAFVYYNKGCVSWYGKNMNKVKISINLCTSLISPLLSPCTILRMKPRTQSGNA